MSVVELTDDNFAAEVEQCKGTVVVDFWRHKCGPCGLMAPKISRLAEARPDVKVCKAEVSEAPAAAVRYGVTSYPTVMIFRAGRPVGKTVGNVPRKEVEQYLT